MKLGEINWKYTFCILFMLAFWFLDGSIKALTFPNIYRIDEENDIELLVEQSEKGIINCTLVNNTVEEITCDSEKYLQKKGFIWKTLHNNNFAMTLAEVSVGPEEEYIFVVNISDMYGKLGKGNYRIVKPIYISDRKVYIAGEFVIDK